MPKFKVGDRVMYGYLKTAIVNRVYQNYNPVRYALNNYNVVIPENLLRVAHFPISHKISDNMVRIVKGTKDKEIKEALLFTIDLVEKYSNLCDRKDKSSNEILDKILAKHRKEINQLTKLLAICFVTNVVLLGFLLREIF